MITKLSTESVLVSDSEATDFPESPLVVSNYPNGDGIGIMGEDGENIYFSYRMAKDIVKVLTEYSKPKKKSK